MTVNPSTQACTSIRKFTSFKSLNARKCVSMIEQMPSHHFNFFLDRGGIKATYNEKIYKNCTLKEWCVVLYETYYCNADLITVCSKRSADDGCEDRPAACIEKYGICNFKVSLNESLNFAEYYIVFHKFKKAHDLLRRYKLQTFEGK